MNLSAVKFGHIGMIYGPKENGQKLLDAIQAKEGGEKGVYFAENWSPEAKIGFQPVFMYLTGEHLQPGENRSYGELFNQFHFEEYSKSQATDGFIGEEAAASECRTGKGDARIHKVFNLA